jgi:hypothetical protein
MRQPWDIAVVLVGSLLWMSSGCSSATALSEDFGESMAAAVQVQRLRSQPVEPTGEVPVLEGQPAERIMRQYIQSFDRSSPAAAPGMLTPSTGSSGSTGLGQ